MWRFSAYPLRVYSHDVILCMLKQINVHFITSETYRELVLTSKSVDKSEAVKTGKSYSETSENTCLFIHRHVNYFRDGKLQMFPFHN